MKHIVLYHANCADGFGAAFAAWQRLGDEALYVPIQYRKDETWETLLSFLSTKMREEAWDALTLPTDAHLHILDFSFKRPLMEQIVLNFASVTWLDHHKTAFEEWCPEHEEHQFKHSLGNIAIILDHGQSGALLAWRWYVPDQPPPALVAHLDDYDRWQFKLEGTKNINKAIWAQAPWTFAQWGQWLSSDNLGALNQEGAVLLRAHEQRVQQTVDKAAMACVLVTPGERVVLHAGLMANCPPDLSSDVGHALAVKSGTFGLLWSIDSAGRCRCSLRSNGNYDVSAIAKTFGGGGHLNAAGFEVPATTLLSWMRSDSLEI